VVVAAAVLAYFLFFNGSSASASTPKDAVKKLLEAGKSNDVNAANKVLCKGDLAVGEATKLGSTGRILTYTIGASSEKNGITSVDVTATSTNNPQPASAKIPVVKEGGSWKVCFTRVLQQLPTGLPSGPSGLPTVPTNGGPSASDSSSSAGLPTNLPSSLPSGLSICSGTTDALSTANAYIGAAEVGLTTFAQSCVYQNSVPTAVTASLNGKFYGAQSTDPNAGQFVFKSTDGGTTVTIKVTKEPDGHFYVTGVQKS